MLNEHPAEAEARWFGKADYIMVGVPAETIPLAARLRRLGLSVETFLAGSEKKQRRKALAIAHVTITADEARKLLEGDAHQAAGCEWAMTPPWEAA